MNPLVHSALIGGTVMAVIAASFALGRGPVHQLRDKPFNETLHEDLAILAAASERIEALNLPRVVQVEPIKPEPDPLMMVLSEPQPMRRKAVVSSDICARHNMRKVYYGSTWRCRK